MRLPDPPVQSIMFGRLLSLSKTRGSLEDRRRGGNWRRIRILRLIGTRGRWDARMLARRRHPKLEGRAKADLLRKTRAEHSLEGGQAPVNSKISVYDDQSSAHVG